MIYIACPYTHPDPDVALQRIEQATLVELALLESGRVPYNALRVSAGITGRAVPPMGWREFDLEILKLCDLMVVVMIEGWDRSKGVDLEVESAVSQDIPVAYVYPSTVIDDLCVLGV